MMPRPSLTVAFAILLLSSTGCGLVFLPVVEKSPNPVQAVQVRDAITGAPLPNASVQGFVVPRSYTGNPWDDSRLDVSAQGWSPQSRKEQTEHLNAKPLVNGDFQLSENSHVAAWQMWFPIYFINFVYNGHAYADRGRRSRISVRADFVCNWT